MRYKTVGLSFILLFCVGCGWHALSPAYKQQYAYLKESLPLSDHFPKTDRFLVILVAARHLDYRDFNHLLYTIAKHPSDGSKNGDVGHAWIYLQGEIEGSFICIEGGHSGELGIIQPKYLDGIMNYVEFGSVVYQPGGRLTYEPNPIRYLWEPQRDGFFQVGSGGHIPTCAAKIPITQQQLEQIVQFISTYPYHEYRLLDQQCAGYVARIAAIAELSLAHTVVLEIPSVVYFKGEAIRLWEDEKYRSLMLSTPDCLERSLWNAIKEGKASHAMGWYKHQIRDGRRKHPTTHH